MTPNVDLKDVWPNIKMLEKCHHIILTDGVCINECFDASSLNSWMLNRSPTYQIDIVYIVTDESL